MNVLVVDDQADNRYLVEVLFKGKGHTVRSVSNGAEAWERLQSEPTHLIVSDILMPVMDGFELCRRVKGDDRFRHIPFIIYTATYTDPQDEALALKLGADRFIVKPCEPDRFLAIVEEVAVSAGNRSNVEKEATESTEEILKLYNERLVKKLEDKMFQLEKEIQARKAAEERLHLVLGNLRQSLTGTIKALAAATEVRDPFTAGHQKRVGELCRALGQEMGLSEERIEGLTLAGVIHDLGKISVPAEILVTPRRLTPTEMKLIQTHPQVGYDILKDIDFPFPVARIVLEHHERLDGSGYPGGLKGNETLLESRILAVADVVEAISSHRPYRPAHSIETALQEISAKKGILYDTAVVETCLRLFREKRFFFRSENEEV